MTRAALGIATVVYVALLAIVLKECMFLFPLRELVWNDYGTWLMGFSALFYVNLFAAIYAVARKVALKDTGDKLTHVEKQLRGGTTLLHELTEKILERK